MKHVICFIILLMTVTSVFSQEKEIIHLWPGTVPGEANPKQIALTTADSSHGVTRLTDITDPAIQVFKPTGKGNGAAVVVCPGGGYQILAINLEGYEIAQWLAKQGFTAFVLQYRVPNKQLGALQDVQRAIRLVRAHAKDWQLNPDKIGVMGFSAGGSLSARVSTLYDKDAYPKTDDIDKLSCKPAFALLIYPAYLDQGPENTITPELAINVQTPPTFLFATADDPYGNSALVMAIALRKAKVPVELHFYATGGHGYGLRAGNSAADVWPALAEKWLAKTVLH